jgi:replicative DNA helicase
MSGFELNPEEALLGALLREPKRLPEASGILSEEDFEEPLRGRVFELIKRLARDGRVADPIVIGSMFEPEETIGEITARQYIHRLAAAVPSVLNFSGYAQQVREMAHRRTLFETGLRIRRGQCVP